MYVLKPLNVGWPRFANGPVKSPAKPILYVSFELEHVPVVAGAATPAAPVVALLVAESPSSPHAAATRHRSVAAATTRVMRRVPEPGIAHPRVAERDSGTPHPRRAL